MARANGTGDFSALLDALSPDNCLGKAVQSVNPQTGAAYQNHSIDPGHV